MYDILDYGRMVGDERRADAFVAGIRAAVEPGMVVVDIGTGSGLFALIAAQCGARRVYAIDPDPIVVLAKELAAENGFADRIEFFRAASREVTLPERADVIVADLRGILPLALDSAGALLDARERFLKPGGRFVPESDTIFVTVVDSEASYRRYTEPWSSAPYGLTFAAARRVGVNFWSRALATTDNMLTSAVRLAHLEYATLASPDLDATVRLEVLRAGTAHGAMLWFDARFADGSILSNAPDLPPAVYGRAFFPFEQAVPVDTGDVITLRIRAKLLNIYLWSWETWVERGGKRIASFAQSTFFAEAVP